MAPLTQQHWRLASSGLASTSGRAPAPAWPRLGRDARPSLARPGAPARQRRGRRACVVVAAGRSLYDVLGVERGADLKAIKRAYKKKALKLHPDVNKAPDAKELFMEAKNAYTTLADERQRRQYDRTLDGGGGFDWSSFGDSFGDAFKGAGQQARSQQQQQQQQRPRPTRPEEEFYGFSDFFKDLGQSVSSGVGQVQALWRDLERELEKRQSGGSGGGDGGSSGGGAKVKSLWQELRDVGEEFVEFLEQEVAGVDRKAQAGRESAEGAAKSAARAEDAAAEAQATQAKAAAEQAKRNADQEIDSMLADLKKNLKK